VPTIRPRVAVTLNEEAHEAVRFLALATGFSMSSVIADLVHTVAPVLSRTAEVVAAAKRARGEQRDGLKAAVADALIRLSPGRFEHGGAGDRQLSLMDGVLERAVLSRSSGNARRGARPSARLSPASAVESGEARQPSAKRGRAVPVAPLTDARLSADGGRRSALRAAVALGVVRRPAGAAAPRAKRADPRLSNTGVRSPRKGAKGTKGKRGKK
jgi:hypothetical protein